MWKILIVSAALVAAPASAQPPQVEIWVDQGEPIPGTDEGALPFFGTMGPEAVAFSGLNVPATGFGVFLADRDGIRELVGGRFWTGVAGLSYDGDWLSFAAFSDGLGCPEEECFTLYRYADGVLTEVIAAGDPLPGHPEEIVFGFFAISTDGGQIVFHVDRGPRDGSGLTIRSAILRFTEADGVEVAVDTDTLVPGAGALTFDHLNEPRISEGSLFFRGFFPGGEGIFVERDGEVSRVAVTGDPLPGGFPGEVFQDFPEEVHPTASGGAVAFYAEGSLGSRGIYWTVGGSVERVVDQSTPVPDAGMGAPIFHDFGQIALSGDELVFEAPLLPFPGVDLFLLRDGEVTRIADGVCSDHLILDGSFRDGRVAFFRPQEERGRLRVVYVDEPPPQGESYVSERYPDFLFTVRISAGTETIPTRLEPECVADALCIGGALPGRAELSLRILGPRPNGRLWPVIGRLSPSRIEVWIEQLSTGLLRYYLLDALPRDSSELTGLVDRRGFPTPP